MYIVGKSVLDVMKNV